MAQRQNNVEVQGLSFGEPPDRLRLRIDNHFAHMTRQQGLRFCLANHIQDRHHRGDREQEWT
jgi:hypothetical protein